MEKFKQGDKVRVNADLKTDLHRHSNTRDSHGRIGIISFSPLNGPEDDILLIEFEGCATLIYTSCLELVEEAKKILGYKFKEGCEKYDEAAKKIAGTHMWSFTPGICFFKGSPSEYSLKDAEVLDLWFEAVYEEEFKAGDYVVCVQDFKERNVGHFVNRVGILIDDKPSTSAQSSGYKYRVTFDKDNIGRTVFEIRKATPQEIEKYKSEQVIKIGEWVVKKYEGNYKIGCKIFTRQSVANLASLMFEQNLKKVSFDGIETDLETLNKILEMK